MLVTRERRAVDVGLAGAPAREEALRVEPDHDRHHRRVREAARAAEVVDDVADGEGAALPDLVHDGALERAEQLPGGCPPDATKGRGHAAIIPLSACGQGGAA